MKPATRFYPNQLVWVVDTILKGALNRLSSLPHDVSWEERKDINGLTAPGKLNWYEIGALEGAGEMLGLLVANLCDNGLSVYDALKMADGFDKKLEELVRQSWEDKGQRIRNRLGSHIGKPFTILYDEEYPGLYPDTRKHAEAFVDGNFKEYLCLNKLTGSTEVLLHTVDYYLLLGNVVLDSDEEASVEESVKELVKEMILHRVSEGDLIHSVDGATLHGRWRIHR